MNVAPCGCFKGEYPGPVLKRLVRHWRKRQRQADRRMCRSMLTGMTAGAIVCVLMLL
jgi:hypothetical protein